MFVLEEMSKWMPYGLPVLTFVVSAAVIIYNVGIRRGQSQQRQLTQRGPKNGRCVS